nr:thylakoid lumenal 16.5 kDa protein, chloroplastic [Ipomoea batatas]
MATFCLSNAKSFLPSLQSSFPSSSSSSPLSIHTQKLNSRRQLIWCKAVDDSHFPPPILISKRSLYLSLTTTLLLSLSGSHGCFDANAAILEADDDEDLLQKVKQDRKKRLERQGLINSSGKERGYLQDLVYKLSKVGQAIEKNDLPAASGVLGQNVETDWVKNVNSALTKFSISPEEKSEVDAFNSSLASLISSVVKNDIEASRTSFVASATAFEKWTTLTATSAAFSTSAISASPRELFTWGAFPCKPSTIWVSFFSSSALPFNTSFLDSSSFSTLFSRSCASSFSSTFSAAASISSFFSSFSPSTSLPAIAPGEPSGFSSAPISLPPGFEAEDFLPRFLGGSLSGGGGGADFTFSLILADLLGVSPVAQSNSDNGGPPGCDFRYCFNWFLLVISSPVGAVKVISLFFEAPPFLFVSCINKEG